MLIREIMERLNMIKMMIFWEPELYNAGTSALWFTWSTCCCDLMRQQCKTAHFAKHRSLLLKKNKKVKRWKHEIERVESVRERERENYEWTEEACLILPQPWPCWSTQTRKLGTADEVNSEWPLNDAAGCQVLTTRLVNKHTYRLPPHSHNTFSTSVNLQTRFQV